MIKVYCFPMGGLPNGVGVDSTLLQKHYIDQILFWKAIMRLIGALNWIGFSKEG